MADILGQIAEIIALVAGPKTILIGSGIALSAAGVVPRVGLFSALKLHWKSYFQSTRPFSVRISEIELLESKITWMENRRYITVLGGKGYGKSCLVDSTLHRHCGVVKFSVSYNSKLLTVNHYIILNYSYISTVNCNHFISADEIGC
jgi:hypothetical protein